VQECTPGVSECTLAGLRTCVAGADGCAAWAEVMACPAGTTCQDGACVAAPPPCSGKAGTFHSQPLESGGETRHYYLHVPSTYSCDTAWPLLVDFHGTGFGGADDPVEESWALPELIEASDSERFLVVRPRSRSKPYNGQYLFQWDINAGDLTRNHEFAVELVADLQQRYHIDPARIYALGFSNGPNMALQFLADEPSIMRGYAAVAGGLNYDLAGGPQFGADAPRIYATTGYRDYMLSTQRRLSSWLDDHGYPQDHLFRRESDTGHELYGWHYHEAFRWMDQGARPAPGQLAAGWVRETSFPTAESLTQLALAPSGTIWAVGAEGEIYHRDTAGSWTQAASVQVKGQAPALSDLCFLDSGVGLAVGEGVVARTSDETTWSTLASVPELGAQNFGYAYLTTLGCGGAHAVAAGVWTAAVSDDSGASWSAADMGQPDAPPFASLVKRSAAGTWLALGYYDYIGRSTDGVHFTPSSVPVDLQWWNGLASGPNGAFWVAGEKGSILFSSDDGQSFSAQAAPGVEDLYAISFAGDGLHGLAVGAHGAVYATADGGATWVDRSTGLDGFLGDVLWLDATTALVAGEGGLVLRFAGL
jgi:predicted esterase/photosystem II stability/assembly factor-like uncharacterized protein